MSAKSKGTAREHQVRKQEEEAGWVATRGAGSHGCADLWLARKDVRGRVAYPELRLVQVKANTGSPYKNFPPSERAELRALAEQTGGTAELCHWPPHGKQRWISQDAWPR